MILLAKAQIIGGIVPNLIAFGLFLGAIGYFALTVMGRVAMLRAKANIDAGVASLKRVSLSILKMYLLSL